jgi:hypothetical protein
MPKLIQILMMGGGLYNAELSTMSVYESRCFIVKCEEMKAFVTGPDLNLNQLGTRWQLKVGASHTR